MKERAWEEQEKNAQLEKELEEIKLAHNINNECRLRVEDNQTRAEKKRKEMDERLAKAVEDGMWARDVLTTAQERANKASQDLLSLQEQRRIFEKIWFEKVFRLKRSVICSTAMVAYNNKLQDFSNCCFWKLFKSM